MKEIDWSKQHCGIIHGQAEDVRNHMPDLRELMDSFPENENDYVWDVKVHMLMPNQYPAIPNWHRDMVPRNEKGQEDFSRITTEYPLWLWVSGDPLTKFMLEDGYAYEIKPKEWYKFTQNDIHCAQKSERFQWRGLIRATHKNLNMNSKNVNNPFGIKSVIRRHAQVYLDANNFKW